MGVLAVILVIRVIDKDARSLAGHVIEAVPDHHEFSETEKAYAEWRFLRTRLVPAEADALKDRLARVDLTHITWKVGEVVDVDRLTFLRWVE